MHIRKKVKNMITLLASYSVFWELLDRERIYLDESLDFTTVCKYMGVPSEGLDNLLFQETGFHGQDILTRFRAIDFSMNYD